MPLFISPKVQEKLANKQPPVTRDEVEQCFTNHPASWPHLFDTRARHASNPPTLWFIGLTDTGRHLKIVFIQKPDGPHLRTAYEPNRVEEQIYNSNIPTPPPLPT